MGGRRNPISRAPSLRSRWLEWALGLMGRYEQVRARYGSPSMVTVRPLSFSARLHERWLMPAVRLYPQLNLSIQPILHLTASGEAKDRKAKHSLQATSPQAMKRQTFRLFGEKHFFKSATVVPQSRTVIERLRALVYNDTPQTSFVSQQNNTGSSTKDVEKLKLRSPSSLQLVFQRLQCADASTEPGMTSLLQQRVTDLAVRVVRQTERVESRAAASPTRVLTRPAALTQQHLITPVFSTEHRAEGMPMAFNQPTGAWAGRNSAQPPGVDMDEITEQVMRRIDSRVVAMRERLGQV
jgi:hypothetical protein